MTYRTFRLAGVSLLTILLVAGGLAHLGAGQRNPQGGGAFTPSADYDLSGDVRFTATQSNTQNPATIGGTQTLTNKTLTSPTITGATLSTATLASPAITGTVTGGASYTAPTLTSPTITGTTAIGAGATLTTPTLTAPVVATFTNTGTGTLPSATGGLPVSLYCGSTGTGNQNCTATAAAATTKIYSGHSTLSSNAAVITFPVAFASTTYDCVANDITTRANVVQMISTSSNTATITNTTGASDVINWICVGQ